eukprot:5515974-Karenia_brevis.AAC.1
MSASSQNESPLPLPANLADLQNNFGTMITRAMKMQRAELSEIFEPRFQTIEADIKHHSTTFGNSWAATRQT